MNSFSSAEQSENEGNNSSEASFQKLSQTIATSIQKILQNGKKSKIYCWNHYKLTSNSVS